MSEEFDSPRQDDQFRELLGVLKRRKVLLVSTVVAFMLLGVLQIALSPTVYQVGENILLQEYLEGPTSEGNDPLARISQSVAPPTIGAQIAKLKSPQIITAAFQEAGVTPPNANDVTGEIVEADQQGTAPVLNVRVNLPDGENAARVAQALPNVYNLDVARENTERVQNATRELNAQLNVARANLKQAQDALEAHLGLQGTLVSVSGGEGGQRTTRLNQFEAQLDEARVDLASAEAQYAASLEAQANVPKKIEETNLGPPVERRVSQERVLADLNGQLKTLLTTYTEGNPEIKALRARLAVEQRYYDSLPKVTDLTREVRNPLRNVYDQRVSDTKAAVNATQVRIAKLEPIVARERAGLARYQARLPRERELQNAVDEKRAAVASASQRVIQVEALVAKGPKTIRVLAISQPTKAQPVVPRTLMVSFVLGLVAGVVAALVRDRFDSRIQTLEQVYDSSGVMPIGEVSVAGRPLALDTGRGRNRALESYRSLRFNLESSNSGSAVQSVLVASASGGEGRTSLAWNLASEAATDARKTILVDADMRTPDLHDRLKVERGPGLSEVLSGAVALQDVLKESGQDGLLFLPAGGDHANPLELLSGPSFEETHNALKEMADVIIFNSPSLMRYTDGRAIARVTDSVVFVAKRGFTRRDAMRYCVGLLRRAKARLLGVVLVDEKGRATDVPGYVTE